MLPRTCHGSADTRPDVGSPQTQGASVPWVSLGWHDGPDMLVLSGIEWDFKHFTEAKRKPDFPQAEKALDLWVDTARAQWPRMAGFGLRTMYYADKAFGSQKNYDAYNEVVDNVVRRHAQPPDSRQCGQVRFFAQNEKAA
jgi:hypothetical protein